MAPRPKLPDGQVPRDSISPHKRYKAAYLDKDHHKSLLDEAKALGVPLGEYIWSLRQGAGPVTVPALPVPEVPAPVVLSPDPAPVAPAAVPSVDWAGLRESLRLGCKIGNLAKLDEVLRDYGMPSE